MSLRPEHVLIYHITDVENLPGILAEGGLRADAVMVEKNPTVIGYAHIKERRMKQIRVPCCGGRFVGEFVPFYFCPRSPMLFTINQGNTGRQAGCQRKIVHLVSTVARGIGLERAWAISDGNAGAAYPSFYADAQSVGGFGLVRHPGHRLAGEDESKVGGVSGGGLFPLDGISGPGLPQQRSGHAGAGFGKLSTPSSGGDSRAGLVLSMIELTKGNLLEAPVEALVNTVNTAGIMGKGIALQFKQAYPQMFREYERACKAGEVELGKVQVFDLGGLVGGPRWVINFPTKGHWRAGSRMADIEAGLKDLVVTIKRLRIRSIAVPPLGCGNGGLDWSDVRPRIESALAELPEVRVLVFAPGGTPEAAAMPNRTERPTMTMGQAALIALMDRYLKGLLDPFVSLLEIHKLMYFLQEAGQPLRLQYEAKEFGPYAKNLRQVLIRLEKHYTQGYGDGKDTPTKAIELMPGAVEEAESFLKNDDTIRQRMNRVTDLIEGFEDPYGLELLSSVHWVMRGNADARESAEAAAVAVHKWNPRKRRLLKKEHLIKAWQRLKEQNWDATLAVA